MSSQREHSPFFLSPICNPSSKTLTDRIYELGVKVNLPRTSIPFSPTLEIQSTARSIGDCIDRQRMVGLLQKLVKIEELHPLAYANQGVLVYIEMLLAAEISNGHKAYPPEWCKQYGLQPFCITTNTTPTNRRPIKSINNRTNAKNPSSSSQVNSITVDKLYLHLKKRTQVIHNLIIPYITTYSALRCFDSMLTAARQGNLQYGGGGGGDNDNNNDDDDDDNDDESNQIGSEMAKPNINENDKIKKQLDELFPRIENFHALLESSKHLNEPHGPFSENLAMLLQEWQRVFDDFLSDPFTQKYCDADTVQMREGLFPDFRDGTGIITLFFIPEVDCQQEYQANVDFLNKHNPNYASLYIKTVASAQIILTGFSSRTEHMIKCCAYVHTPEYSMGFLFTMLFSIFTLYGSPYKQKQTTSTYTYHVGQKQIDKFERNHAVAVSRRSPRNVLYLMQELLDPKYSDILRDFSQCPILLPSFTANMSLQGTIFEVACRLALNEVVTMFIQAKYTPPPSLYKQLTLNESASELSDIAFHQCFSIVPISTLNEGVVDFINELTPFPIPTHAHQLQIAANLVKFPNVEIEFDGALQVLLENTAYQPLHLYMDAVSNKTIPVHGYPSMKMLYNEPWQQGINLRPGTLMALIVEIRNWIRNTKKYTLLPILWNVLINHQYVEKIDAKAILSYLTIDALVYDRQLDFDGLDFIPSSDIPWLPTNIYHQCNVLNKSGAVPEWLPQSTMFENFNFIQYSKPNNSPNTQSIPSVPANSLTPSNNSTTPSSSLTNPCNITSNSIQLWYDRPEYNLPMDVLTPPPGNITLQFPLTRWNPVPPASTILEVQTNHPSSSIDEDCPAMIVERFWQRFNPWTRKLRPHVQPHESKLSSLFNERYNPSDQQTIQPPTPSLEQQKYTPELYKQTTIISKIHPHDQSNHLVPSLTPNGFNSSIKSTAYSMRLLFQDIITADDVELLALCVSACDSIFPHTIPYLPFLDFKNNTAALCYAIRRGAFNSVHYLLLELNNFANNNLSHTQSRSPHHKNTNKPPSKTDERKKVNNSTQTTLESEKIGIETTTTTTTNNNNQTTLEYNIDLNSLTPLHSLSLIEFPRGCRLHNNNGCNLCPTQKETIEYIQSHVKMFTYLPQSYIKAVFSQSDNHKYGNPLNYAICQGSYIPFELFPDYPINLCTLVDDFSHLLHRNNSAMILHSEKSKMAYDMYSLGVVPTTHRVDEKDKLINDVITVKQNENCSYITVPTPKFDPTWNQNYFGIDNYYKHREKKKEKIIHEPMIGVDSIGTALYTNFNPIDGILTNHYPGELSSKFHFNTSSTAPLLNQHEFYRLADIDMIALGAPTSTSLVKPSTSRFITLLQQRPEYDDICIILAKSLQEEHYNAYFEEQLTEGMKLQKNIECYRSSPPPIAGRLSSPNSAGLQPVKESPHRLRGFLLEKDFSLADDYSGLVSSVVDLMINRGIQFINKKQQE